MLGEIHAKNIWKCNKFYWHNEPLELHWNGYWMAN
jgi:hypothetical protein